jgi:Plant transposon protein
MDSSSDESFDEDFINDITMNEEVEEEQHQLLLAFVDLVFGDNEDEPVIRGGSVQGKAGNIDRNRRAFDVQLNRDYFDDNPTYDLDTFRRRFRMRRELYLQIETRLQQSYRFFTQRADATGMLGISSRLKIITAIRMLANGCSSDDFDDRSRIAESTMLEVLDCFCAAIIEQYSEEFLREPTEDDLVQILRDSQQKGWPGMLGSIDCMHWKWKNCPKAWAGMFKGKESGPTIVLQVVADTTLRIWHHYFGMPGSSNDINVLERSDLLHSLLNGRCPRVHYSVNNCPYTVGYWLGDGIYPTHAYIVKAYKTPFLIHVEKQQKFTARQESRRKDVERCFAMLQQKWHVLTQPCRFWRADSIGSMMKACIILHNMILKDELVPVHIEPGNDNFDVLPPAHPPDEQLNQYRDAFIRHVTDAAVHNQLQRDLMEHRWTIDDDDDD